MFPNWVCLLHCILIIVLKYGFPLQVQRNTYFVGNKAKGRISKQVSQENKVRQIFRKTNVSYLLIRTHTWEYQGGKKCLFFRKKIVVWNSSLCLITDDLAYFWPEFPFLYHVKTTNKQRFPSVFWECKTAKLAWNGQIKIYIAENNAPDKIVTIRYFPRRLLTLKDMQCSEIIPASWEYYTFELLFYIWIV